MKLGETTGADKVINPQHFRSDLADIQIQINPDSNLGSLLVEILALVEVCSLCAQSSICTVLHTALVVAVEATAVQTVWYVYCLSLVSEVYHNFSVPCVAVLHVTVCMCACLIYSCAVITV